MVEIKENMYVRTDKGEIKKVFQYDEQDNNPLFCTLNCYATMKGTISKSSYNIIDLIEVGDLLKIEYYSLRYEERVTRLFEVTYKDERYINLSNAKCEFMLIENEFNKGDKELEPIIKSILTKEQFEQIEYIVGGINN